MTLRSEAAILVVSTQSGPASPEPYFAAALTSPPLNASVDELVEVDAAYSGESNMTNLTVVEDGQQVDLLLSSTCGPTLVPGGLISTDTTWSPGCGPYVIAGNLLVQNGITLTVEAGTTVRFNADTALEVDGVVDARGAANAMITFTSNEGGAPGDWAYIYLHETLEPMPFDYLRYVLIEYAGGVSVTDNAALRVNGAWPILGHLTVRHTASDGVRFYNGAIGGIGPATIYDNAGWGIYANSTSLSAPIGGLDVHNNASGGIYISGAGPVWVEYSTIRDNGGRGIEGHGSGVDLYVLNCLIDGNSASSGGGGIHVSDLTLSLSDSWVTGNLASGSSDGGGIYCTAYSTCLIRRNVISGNSAGDSGGGMYVANGSTSYPHEIQNNIFSGNSAGNGGGLAVVGGPVTYGVSNNSFLDNTATGHGAAMYISRDIAITENTILHNTAGLDRGGIYAKNHPVFNWNNLYGNSDYDLYNDNAQGSDDLNAEYNWWGTHELPLIMAHIWDWYDDSTLGMVDHDPWLAGHSLLAPISPPTGLAASSDGITITLTWSPNPEADLAGYKVYYDADGPGLPYGGTGANEGDTPVDVGNVLSATLSGLAPATYYLSVTAYDTYADGSDDQTDGNESWFAYEVTAHIVGEAYADFSGAPTSGAAPLLVTFTNGSTGDFDTCAWTFGDGGTSSSCSDPTHTYAAAGAYTVTLTVSGPGGTDTLTRPDYITVSEPPLVADFSGAPLAGQPPLTVDFTDLSTGPITTWLWDFGDGASSPAEEPSHTYTSAGTFTVSLTVTGPGGTDTELKPEYVVVSHEPIIANFSADPTNGPAPLSVQFSDESAGTITLWLWDFGDGTTSTLPGPTHVYTQAGLFDVSLIVTGPVGSDTETKAEYIAVWAKYRVYLPMVIRNQ